MSALAEVTRASDTFLFVRFRLGRLIRRYPREEVSCVRDTCDTWLFGIRAQVSIFREIYASLGVTRKPVV